jgi:hypothetical protein
VHSCDGNNSRQDHHVRPQNHLAHRIITGIPADRSDLSLRRAPGLGADSRRFDSSTSGTATITRGSTTIPAAYGIKVDVGDRIVTAAASTLTIDENTLNANGTRASTKLSLLNGLVRSLVRTTPGTPPNYEVHTPNAVASARHRLRRRP